MEHLYSGLQCVIFLKRQDVNLWIYEIKDEVTQDFPRFSINQIVENKVLKWCKTNIQSIKSWTISCYRHEIILVNYLNFQ